MFPPALQDWGVTIPKPSWHARHLTLPIFHPFPSLLLLVYQICLSKRKKKILKQKTLLQKHFLYRTTIRYILDIHLIEKFLLSEGKMKGNKIIVIKTVLEVDLTKELVHYIFGSTNGTFIELYVYKLIK